MKKILCLLIGFMLFIPISIYGKTVDLSEVNLSIDFNDDWYAFTRYNLDNNKELESLGLTKEYILKGAGLIGYIYHFSFKEIMKMKVSEFMFFIEDSKNYIPKER